MPTDAELVYALQARHWKDLTPWERRFIDDMSYRLHRFKATPTPAQRKTLDELAKRMVSRALRWPTEGAPQGK